MQRHFDPRFHIRRNIDSSITDKQRAPSRRRQHREQMYQTFIGADPCRTPHNPTHKHICMKLALGKTVRLASGKQCQGHINRAVFICRIDNFSARKVPANGSSISEDLVSFPDQYGPC